MRVKQLQSALPLFLEYWKKIKLGRCRCLIHFEYADGRLLELQMPFLKTFDFYDLDQRTHSLQTEIHVSIGRFSCWLFSQIGLLFANWQWHHAREYLFPAFFYKQHNELSLSPNWSIIPLQCIVSFLFLCCTVTHSADSLAALKGYGLSLTSNAHFP